MIISNTLTRLDKRKRWRAEMSAKAEGNILKRQEDHFKAE
jgi:hypothetical protein